MKTTIRPAEQSDLPAILDIINHAILHSTAHYAYEPETLEDLEKWWAQKQQKGMPVVVADMGEGVLAYGAYDQFRDRIGYRFCVEHSVYVAEGQQGKGLGSAILLHLIERAREDGMHTMIAGMDSANQGSYTFHHKHGFREIARFKEVGYKFDQWLDVIFMQLML